MMTIFFLAPMMSIDSTNVASASTLSPLRTPTQCDVPHNEHYSWQPEQSECKTELPLDTVSNLLGLDSNTQKFPVELICDNSLLTRNSINDPRNQGG